MRHGIELNRTVLFFYYYCHFYYFSSSFMIVRKFQYPDLIISGHEFEREKNIVDNDNEDYKNKELLTRDRKRCNVCVVYKI